MSNRFGVIAEDDTDFEVMRTLIQRHLGSHVGVKKRVANGCAKIPIKAESWLRELAQRDCNAAIILHDLDRDPRTNALNDESALAAKLGAIPLPAGIRRFVCIPVEEIEAWFWSDDAIIKKVTNGRAKGHSSPHNVVRPKEALTRLSCGETGHWRYSTNMNAELAQALNFSVCAQRCPAFANLLAFLGRA